MINTSWVTASGVVTVNVRLCVLVSGKTLLKARLLLPELNEVDITARNWSSAVLER